MTIKKHILTTLFILLLIDNIVAQQYNRPIPNVLFPYEFSSEIQEEKKFLLATPSPLKIKPKDKNFSSSKAVIIDNNGFVYWYLNCDGASPTDFKYLSKDSLFLFARYINGTTSFMIMDLNLNIIDSLSNANQVLSDAHEFQKLANGNYIIGGVKDSVMDLSGLKFNGKQGSKKTIVRGYVMQEFNKKHELVFEWNSNAHIHPKEAYESYAYDSTKFDYAHGNSIEEDDDGNLLVSFRNLNSVYKINHVTGKVMWRLGGKSNDFKFINDSGFSGQHDARRLANGNISLFNNSNTTPLPDGSILPHETPFSSTTPISSSALQYKLDTVKYTATAVWKYTLPFFVKATGNYQIKNSNYHVINCGSSLRPHPNILIIDQNKKLLTSLSFQDSVTSYRSFYAEIPFRIKQEKIRVSQYGNKILLVAPDGFKKYLWSTGDTLQYIIVDKFQWYQVWMNYGAGMLGSAPLNLLKNTENDLYLLDDQMQKIIYPKIGEAYYYKELDGEKKEIIWK